MLKLESAEKPGKGRHIVVDKMENNVDQEGRQAF